MNSRRCYTVHRGIGGTADRYARKWAGSHCMFRADMDGLLSRKVWIALRVRSEQLDWDGNEVYVSTCGDVHITT